MQRSSSAKIQDKETAMMQNHGKLVSAAEYKLKRLIGTF